MKQTWPLWLDVETVGLNGPVMRIQWAVGDGPIHFLDYPFADSSPADDLLSLLRAPGVLLVAYNAAFDVYHLYRWVHQHIMGLRLDSPERPVEPFQCRVLDLQVPAMLHGPFKNFAFTKGRGKAVTRIRRIPLAVADRVEQEVKSKLVGLLPEGFGIHVGRHKVPDRPDLVTVSFNVEGRTTLKAHAKYYGADTISLADDVWPIMPMKLEKPWLPYWEGDHYNEYIEKAKKILGAKTIFDLYCELDIWFLRLLACGLRESGVGGLDELVDHHSDCVHAVAYTRYHGFEIDRAKLGEVKDHYERRVTQMEADLRGINLRSSKQRLALLQSADPLVGATNKTVLKMLVQTSRPSAHIAKTMLNYGACRQQLLQAEKVLESKTNRAHPSLRVMGTGTGRMAGEAGVNWQGITKALPSMREAILCSSGGDFDALEVCIAAAVYEDKQLQQDLDDGVDLHAMTASMLPAARAGGWSYEKILMHKNKKGSPAGKLRSTGKTCVFSTLYGAEAQRIAEVIGGTLDEAKAFQERFFGRYQGIGSYRASQLKRICTADTESWSDGSVAKMGVAVGDATGFVRFFTFERAVADIVWRLGCRGIKTGVGGSVVRSVEKGSQSVDQAVRSGLFGAAIAVQQAVYRQVCNAPIQATGANLTKKLMARIWNALRIPLLNVHDELITTSSNLEQISSITLEFLAEWRKVIPSLNIEFKSITNWSEK